MSAQEHLKDECCPLARAQETGRYQRWATACDGQVEREGGSAGRRPVLASWGLEVSGCVREWDVLSATSSSQMI
jgi:hypothetical protein